MESVWSFPYDNREFKKEVIALDFFFFVILCFPPLWLFAIKTLYFIYPEKIQLTLRPLPDITEFIINSKDAFYLKLCIAVTWKGNKGKPWISSFNFTKTNQKKVLTHSVYSQAQCPWLNQALASTSKFIYVILPICQTQKDRHMKTDSLLNTFRWGQL